MHRLALELLLALCGAAMVYDCLAIVAARRFFLQPRAVAREFHPPIAILIPVHGLDRGAAENFRSLCRQEYPSYQVIVGVDNARDPAIPLVRQIIREFPERTIRLVMGRQRHGANPKVSNLANMEPEATDPLVLIVDSDIRVGPDYLRRLVQPLRDPQVGLVTCMCRSVARGPAETLEALRISTEFCPSVLVAARVGAISFALGSSMLVRRSVLTAIGGFQAVGDYLADDYRLGHLVAASGSRVVLSEYVVDHTLATGTLRDLIARQVRWNRGIRAARPAGYAGLLVTYGAPMSLMLVVVAGGALWSWAVLGATWTVRCGMAWIVGARCLRDPSAARYWWLAPIQDMLSCVLWGVSLFGTTIRWRDHSFRLTRSGKLAEVSVAPS